MVIRRNGNKKHRRHSKNNNLNNILIVSWFFARILFTRRPSSSFYVHTHTQWRTAKQTLKLDRKKMSGPIGTHKLSTKWLVLLHLLHQCHRRNIKCCKLTNNERNEEKFFGYVVVTLSWFWLKDSVHTAAWSHIASIAPKQNAWGNWWVGFRLNCCVWMCADVLFPCIHFRWCGRGTAKSNS